MAEMLPYIMDTKFNTIGVIDDYISFIWTTRYYLCGDFELVVEHTKKARELLQLNNYIYRADDEHMGFIERIRLERSDDGHETLLVSGRFLAGLLARRLVVGYVSMGTYGLGFPFNGTFKECIKRLIYYNAGHLNAIYTPNNTARRFEPQLIFDENCNINKQVDRRFSEGTLLSCIETVCKAHNVGFKLLYDADLNKFVFKLFEGVDRSYNQNENPFIVFSPEYGNIGSMVYEFDQKSLVNESLAMSSNYLEQDDRLGFAAGYRYYWTGLYSDESPTGLNRYEKYVIVDVNYDDYATKTDLENAMLTEARRAFAPYTKAFSGNVIFDYYNYRDDVYIGDIVTIENKDWDVLVNARIIEVIESMDESGTYTITPTFAVES